MERSNGIDRKTSLNRRGQPICQVSHYEKENKSILISRHLQKDSKTKTSNKLNIP